VSRGNDFADSFKLSFFLKAFPTLFPRDVGGPRLADEDGLLLKLKLGAACTVDAAEHRVGNLLKEHELG
jgi:hypothetical protein